MEKSGTNLMKDQIFLLLNEAYQLVEVKSKLKKLSAIQELVLNRTESIELKQIVAEELVKFTTSIVSHASIVKNILNFLEKLYFKHPTPFACIYLSFFNVLFTLNCSTAVQMQAVQLLKKEKKNICQLVCKSELSVEVMDQHVDTILNALLHTIQQRELFIQVTQYLQQLVLVFSVPTDAEFRDRERSAVKPDEFTLGSFKTMGTALKQQIQDMGLKVTKTLCERLMDAQSKYGVLKFGACESCYLVNCISLIGCLRPSLVHAVLPTLLGFTKRKLHEEYSTIVQAALSKTIIASLIKLLRFPSTLDYSQQSLDFIQQNFPKNKDRVMTAIQSAKEPTRRRYLSASNSESLKRARLSSTSKEKIKRLKVQTDRSSDLATVSSSANEFLLLTQEKIMSMGIDDLIDTIFSNNRFVISTDTSEFVIPVAKKNFFSDLLSGLATPTSVVSNEASSRRKRDPRRRRDPRLKAEPEKDIALVGIFPSSADLIELCDIIFSTSSQQGETENIMKEVKKDEDEEKMEDETPLKKSIEIGPDNSIIVNVQPLAEKECLKLAIQATKRIVDGEEGIIISGLNHVRIPLIARLGSNRWLTNTSRLSNVAGTTSTNQLRVPVVYQHIVDFIKSDVVNRVDLAISVVYHEYKYEIQHQIEIFRCNSSSNSSSNHLKCQLEGAKNSKWSSLYDALVFSMLQAMQPSLLTERKLYSRFISSLPRITVGVLQKVNELFQPNKKNKEPTQNIVLGITTLRNLIMERHDCQLSCLQLLLFYSCHSDSTIRNPTMRCLANQLYALKPIFIEKFATKLVNTLFNNPIPEQEEYEQMQTQDEKLDIDCTGTESQKKPSADFQHLLTQFDALNEITKSNILMKYVQSLEIELLSRSKTTLKPQRKNVTAAAGGVKESIWNFQAETKDEILTRLEFYLALCAKQTSLFPHLVTVCNNIVHDEVRLVLLHSIDQLVLHMKQKEGETALLEHFISWENKISESNEGAIAFISHTIEILSANKKEGKNNEEEYLKLILQLKEKFQSVIILIPVLASLNEEQLINLLPELASLSDESLIQSAFVKISHKILPNRLLVLLHQMNIMNTTTTSIQKQLISTIENTIQLHPLIFTEDVLKKATRDLLLQEEIPRLGMRTLIQAVLRYPQLRKHAGDLLMELILRQTKVEEGNMETKLIWDQEDSAIWTGFMKCCSLIQPLSFPVLLKLPLAQLDQILNDEKQLLAPLKEFLLVPELLAKLQAFSNPVCQALQITEEDILNVEKVKLEQEKQKESSTEQNEVSQGVEKMQTN